MRTKTALDQLRLLLTQAGMGQLDERLLVYNLQRADRRLWELVRPWFSNTITDELTITVTSSMVSQGYLELNGIPSVDRVTAIRITYSGTLSKPSAHRYEAESLAAQGTKTIPCHRFINAGAGNPPRLEVYPFPEADDTLTVEYLRAPNQPDLFRDAVGTLTREDGEWSKTAGRWPFTENQLQGEAFFLADGGVVQERTIQENGNSSNPYCDLGISGTGTRSGVPALIDIASELPEIVASSLPLAAFDFATRARLTDQTRNEVMDALKDVERPSEIIEEGDFEHNPYLRGVSGHAERYGTDYEDY
ncbi:hypothetical protein KQI63_05810 [bacterium]|nr:hypothetical protein [bacterium]